MVEQVRRRSMAFSERIQQVCDGISEEQATELREFLVQASHRIQSEPNVMAMSLQQVSEVATEQGFAWGSIVNCLHQLARSTLLQGEHEQWKNTWEDFLVSQRSTAEFAAVMHESYPAMVQTLEELIDQAITEDRALKTVAGGVHVFSPGGTSTWRSNPNRTKKGTADSIAIDALEASAAVVALSLIFNVGYGRLNYWFGGRNALRELNPANPRYGRFIGPSWDSAPAFHLPQEENFFVPNPSGGVKVSPTSRLGVYGTDITFDTWKDRLNFSWEHFKPTNAYKRLRGGNAQQAADNAAADDDSQLDLTRMSRNSSMNRPNSGTDIDSENDSVQDQNLPGPEQDPSDLDISGRIDLPDPADINLRRLSLTCRRNYSLLEDDIDNGSGIRLGHKSVSPDFANTRVAERIHISGDSFAEDAKSSLDSEEESIEHDAVSQAERDTSAAANDIDNSIDDAV
jgi:hypothetical protein